MGCRLGRGGSPGAGPPGHIPAARGFSARPRSCGSPFSLTATPSLPPGMWPSLAFPAHEKARDSPQLPPRPGPDPGSRIPPSTHGTFSLSPCSPANSLPRTHPGLLRHRLVSLPAPCMLPALPKLYAGLRLSYSPAPKKDHTSQAPSRPWLRVSHGTRCSRCPQPCRSSARVSLHLSVPGLTLRIPTSPGL